MPNPMAIIYGIQLGAGLLEGIMGASSERKMAGAGIESINRQIQLLGEQKAQLQEAYTQKKQFVTDRYGNQVKSLSQRVGESLYDIERARESGIAQTGLAYSGTVEEQASHLKGRQRKGYQLGFESLAQQLKEAHGLLDIQREQDVANIDLTVAGLEGERKMLEAQKESKFLGIF